MMHFLDLLARRHMLPVSGWVTILSLLAGAPLVLADEGRPVTRSVPLQEGENWVSLFLVPESNTLGAVLGLNRLPAGPHAFASTRVSWHGMLPGGEATNVVWLDEATGWRFLDGEGANAYPMPLDQGFSLFLPEGRGATNLIVREWIPSDRMEGDLLVHTLLPSGAYNVVKLVLAAPLAVTNSGLREAGFVGAPDGAKVNPNNSDELRILQGGGDSLAAPRARILMDAGGHFVFWTGGSFLGSAEEYELGDGDTVIIQTTRSTSNRYWRLPLP